MDHLRREEKTHTNGYVTEHVATNIDHWQCRENIFVDRLETRLDDRTRTSHSFVSNCSSGKGLAHCSSIDAMRTCRAHPCQSTLLICSLICREELRLHMSDNVSRGGGTLLRTRTQPFEYAGMLFQFDLERIRQQTREDRSSSTRMRHETGGARRWLFHSC
jgi:hypothetical protein